jgi:hypothetical protein
MPIPRPNRRAVASTVRALRLTGRLEKVDESVIALARMSADLLDEARAYEHEKLYALTGHMRVHLSILQVLIGREEHVDNDLAELLAGLSNEAMHDAFEQGRNVTVFGDRAGPDGDPWR